MRGFPATAMSELGGAAKCDGLVLLEVKGIFGYEKSCLEPDFELTELVDSYCRSADT